MSRKFEPFPPTGQNSKKPENCFKAEKEKHGKRKKRNIRGNPSFSAEWLLWKVH